MLPSLSAATFECGRPQIVFEGGRCQIVIEPKPWTIESLVGSFKVVDAHLQILALGQTEES